MLFSHYVKDRGTAFKILDKVGTALLVSLILNVVLLVTSLTNYERFILTPFNLDQRAELAYDSASKALHKNYAVSLSALIGNLTPLTVDTAVTAVSRMFTSRLYQRMHPQLKSQATKIKNGGLTITFIPDHIIYEPETGKTFVTGTKTVKSIQGEPREELVSFEYKLIVKAYVPWIDHFDFYKGVARTTVWIAKNKNILDKEQREREEKLKAESE